MSASEILVGAMRLLELFQEGELRHSRVHGAITCAPYGYNTFVNFCSV